MKKLSILALAFLASCSSGPQNQTPKAENTPQTAPVETVASPLNAADAKNYFNVSFAQAKEFTYKNIQILPILAGPAMLANSAGLGHYLSLKEAQEKNAIKIAEKGDGQVHANYQDNRSNSNLRSRHGARHQNNGSNSISDNALNSNSSLLMPPGSTGTNPLNSYSSENSSPEVNELTIENTSKDTVYIMSGEVVKGGQQDRMVAEDIIVPPHTKNMAFKVFCVEHGRWTPRENGGMAFTGYANVASNSVRVAGVSGNQGAVWDNVAQVVSLNAASSSTGTYTALEQSNKYNGSMEDYLKYYETKFATAKNVVGILVISGDKVVGMDVFCNPALFQKERSALLHSYITDALTFGKTPSLPQSKIEDYFTTALKNYHLPKDQKAAEVKFIHAGKVVHYARF